MTHTTIPASQNEAWGFWGTMNEHANAAWPLAMNAISDATGQPRESVRTFLDSRHGRCGFCLRDLWRDVISQQIGDRVNLLHGQPTKDWDFKDARGIVADPPWREDLGWLDVGQSGHLLLRVERSSNLAAACCCRNRNRLTSVCWCDCWSSADAGDA